MNELSVYRFLEKTSSIFYEKYQHRIEKMAYDERKEEIKKKLSTLLKGSFMVWCCNGNVNHLKLPCSEEECIFKSNKKDIINGCSKCQLFPITSISKCWGSAKHFDLDGESTYID